MITILKTWFHRYLSHPQAGILFFAILAFTLFVSILGHTFAPIFASIIVAYLLETLVTPLIRITYKRWIAVLIVYCLFLSTFILLTLVLLPLLWQQTTNLLTQLPNILGQGQILITKLQQNYPKVFTTQEISTVLQQFHSNLAHYGQLALSISLASIPTILTLVVYLVLVPLLIYFLLIDRNKLLSWLNHYAPKHRGALDNIWAELHTQLGNYIKGKALEIIIVSGVTYVSFVLLGLSYNLLLAVAVGFSVLIPYIGALLVTIPVLIIGFTQWGWSSHFAWLVAVYGTIITLDGNVLVPLLFSEAVSLHPVAIIVSVVFFGAIWGFWGIFFAIPLASLVKAILLHWPTVD